MTDMLRGVLENGTGTPANLGRPAAGKTGTTDNYETAWFIGYTPELLVGIYTGNDNRQPIGISGTEVSALWGKMMQQAGADRSAVNFTVPDNVITGVAICANSGKPAGPGCREVEYMAFIRGTQPNAGARDPKSGTEASKPEPDKKNPLQQILPWLRLPGL